MPPTDASIDQPLGLVGRDAELAQLMLALQAARLGAGSAMTLRGDPGIGKSALGARVTDLADDFRVAHCRGVESEAELPFSGLHELLRPLRGDFDALDPAERETLLLALALGDGTHAAPVQVSLATLNLVAHVAAQRPLLLFVDDLHWIDGATRAVLTFLARRIDHDSVFLLLTVRPEIEPEAFPGTLIELGPLTPAAVTELMRSRMSRPLLAASVEAVAEASGGNPLAVIETIRLVGSGLDQLGSLLDEPAPPGELIERGFATRLSPLPADTQHALVVTAAALQDAPDTLHAALHELGLPAAALDEAESAGVIVRRSGRLEFSHPLLRALVYHRAEPGLRRQAHAALATAATDRGTRAWHAAAASSRPDEATAAELADVAADFELRGGYVAAARALERAARLSPARGDRAERLLSAAVVARRALRITWSRAMTDEAYQLADDPLLRVRIDTERSVLAFYSGTATDIKAQHLQQARDCSGGDPAVVVEALVKAGITATIAGNVSEAQALVPEIEALLPVGQLRTNEEADAFRGVVNLLAATNPTHGRELLVHCARLRIASPSRDGSFIAEALMWLDEDELCAELLSALTTHGEARGDLDGNIDRLWAAGYRCLKRGEWAQSAVAFHQAARQAELTEQEWPAQACKAVSLLVHASRGDDATVELSQGVLEFSRSSPNFGVLEPYVHTARGLLALGAANGREAVRHLEQARAWCAAAGYRERGIWSWPVDLVDAYALVGDTERARESLDQLRSWAVHANRTSALAAVARLDGVLGGDDYAAHFESALASYSAFARPFEIARTQLAFGRRLRRSGRRTAARAQLTLAADAFSRLGAAGWLAQADTELKVTGARIPAGRSDRALTSQEDAVASFVAQGMTNKQVAAQLFLTPKTIEWHLRQIYRKLGITSRTQLAAHVHADGANVA